MNHRSERRRTRGSPTASAESRCGLGGPGVRAAIERTASRFAGAIGPFDGRRALAGMFLVLGGAGASAADVEGWMRQQAERQGAAPDSCADTIARANVTRSGDTSHQAGLCYLRAPRADLFAARAWLGDAAAQDHAPARELLARIASLERESHATAAHCHDLGEGRRLCHGAPAPAALPAR